MKNLRRVVWTKGMFLTPQHFQAQDRFVEDSLDFRFRESCYANWGVSALKIDKEALAGGQFRLEECRGVTPDGVAFDMPESEPLLASRDLKERFPTNASLLDVYLAIPEVRSRARNTALTKADSDAAASLRYVAELHHLRDENGDPDEKEVQLASKNFRILFGGEPDSGFTTLRLAQVQREADGTYGLNRDCVPPCLDISASPTIQDILRRQVEILGAKIASLREARREGARGVAKFTPSDLGDYWLLHSLSTHVPVLNHYLQVKKGHPEPIYATMLELAGGLSAFSMEADPLQFPLYDHADCGPCFVALDATLRSMLQVARRDDCVHIRLNPVDRFVWAGSVPDDSLFEGTRFFLSISADLGIDELIQRAPQQLKLSAPDDIQRLVDRALPGIPLRHDPAPPPAVRLRLQDQCFSISQHGVLWDQVAKSRSLNLYVPAAIPNPRVEVLIVTS